MPEISLNVAEIFQQAFGYRPSAFELELESGLSPSYLPKSVEHPYGPDKNTSKNHPVVGRDKFGRDYYMPVELNGHSLEYPVISITAGKNIVETTLTERQGTVKELVSSGDWEITIRGLIISENGGFPEDEMQEMVNLFHIDKTVEIKSALTDLVLIRSDRKGESSVVIKELTFPEVKGIMNVRPYELKLVSDAPFNLEEVG